VGTVTYDTRKGALSVLREGRLSLLHVVTDYEQEFKLITAVGRVQGHRGIYVIDYDGDAWTCTCGPHMRGERPRCAHIHAVQLVTGLPEPATREAWLQLVGGR
jgi:hypothetical protein